MAGGSNMPDGELLRRKPTTPKTLDREQDHATRYRGGGREVLGRLAAAAGLAVCGDRIRRRRRPPGGSGSGCGAGGRPSRRPSPNLEVLERMCRAGPLDAAAAGWDQLRVCSRP